MLRKRQPEELGLIREGLEAEHAVPYRYGLNCDSTASRFGRGRVTIGPRVAQTCSDLRASGYSPDVGIGSVNLKIFSDSCQIIQGGFGILELSRPPHFRAQSVVDRRHGISAGGYLCQQPREIAEHS
ncbi:hypothetical protein D3C79_835580 [compost metagenome]